MKFSFLDIRNGEILSLIMNLISVLKSFSVKRDLCKLHEFLLQTVKTLDDAFKDSMKVFAPYEIKRNDGLAFISSDTMPDDIKALFLETMKRWNETFLDFEKRIVILLPESIANNLELPPSQMILLEKYFDIEVTVDNEIDFLREKVATLEKAIEKANAAQRAVKNALQ